MCSAYQVVSITSSLEGRVIIQLFLKASNKIISYVIATLCPYKNLTNPDSVYQPPSVDANTPFIKVYNYVQ